MSLKKITYNSKTRNDISNPYHKFSHQDLLRLANISTFNGNFEIEKLHNGRIKVNAIVKSKSSKK
ncbi:hypothetical protein CMT57_08150 [Elizabethkingia anophelis]|nr:hypothetical protein [Elizabethkingia anophelis]MDV3788664.1 hypothetical protein [Elizabethkingia anophelis]MDV4009803.1 hypothetical protein [Elizabethkingia anophelis]